MRSHRALRALFWIAALFTLALLPLGHAPGIAGREAGGELDAGFGDGGKVMTPAHAPASQAGVAAVAVQPDSKIVAVGFAHGSGNRDFALVRYNPDGSLDTSFGFRGRVTTDIGGHDEATALALQPDGKIVVVGWTRPTRSGATTGLAARYNPDGSPDAGFGAAGRVLDVGLNAAGVAVDAEGRAVIVGQASTTTDKEHSMMAVRLLPNGAPDPAFSRSAYLPYSMDYSQALSVALQRDGNIVVAGYRGKGNAADFAVVRLLADGALDPSFGAAGTLRTDIAFGRNIAHALALQADGRIVVAGEAVPAARTTSDFALVRYDARGRLDPGFGYEGKVLVTIGAGDDVARAIAVQDDGKILVGGTADTGAQADFALARLDTGGWLDESFGAGGIIRTDFGGSSDGAAAIALLPAGETLLAGSARTGVRRASFAIARYDASGGADAGFGSGGKLTTAVPGFDNVAGRARSIALQRNGKILLGVSPGEFREEGFALLRLMPDGRADPTFGLGGHVVTGLGEQNVGTALALQADGKIVVGGSYEEKMALMRYRPDGSLDTGFGANGMVLEHTWGGGKLATAVLALDGGKLLVAGGRDAGVALARYNADGSRDPGFGEGGQVVTGGFGGVADVVGAALDSRGRIVVAGDVEHWPCRHCPRGYRMVARYLPDGRPDPSFGRDGIVMGDFTWWERVGAMALQADDKILLTEGITLVRYNTDGTLDPTFDGDGIAATGLRSEDLSGSIAVQQDGKIIVGAGSPQRFGFGLARFNADGSLDGSFGDNGILTTRFAYEAEVFALALQPDGKIVAAGQAEVLVAGQTTDEIAVTRYLNAPSGPGQTATPGTTAPATPTIPPGCVFSDVCIDDYFYEPVRLLAAKGAISGYGDNSFRPFDNATRGQVCKILVVAEGWPLDTAGGPHFGDVPPENPFYPYVETAHGRGIVGGYADGSFRWATEMSRGQLAKVVVLAEGWPIDTSGGRHFHDVPPESPFYEFVETAHKRGVISGYADGSFRWGNPATRGQIARIISGAIGARMLQQPSGDAGH